MLNKTLTISLMSLVVVSPLFAEDPLTSDPKKCSITFSVTKYNSAAYKDLQVSFRVLLPNSQVASPEPVHNGDTKTLYIDCNKYFIIQADSFTQKPAITSLVSKPNRKKSCTYPTDGTYKILSPGTPTAATNHLDLVYPKSFNCPLN